MNSRLECVWKNVPDAVRREAVEFWLAEGAIKEREQAEQRAERLLVVARDGDGQLIAASTAYKEVMHNFGFCLFLFQMYIGKKYRRPGLAQDIIVRAWRELNQRFQAGTDRDALGLVMEITNAKAMRVRNETVWRDKGMEAVYVGKSRRGFHLRVWYFEDARIPQ